MAVDQEDTVSLYLDLCAASANGVIILLALPLQLPNLVLGFSERRFEVDNLAQLVSDIRLRVFQLLFQK